MFMISVIYPNIVGLQQAETRESDLETWLHQFRVSSPAINRPGQWSDAANATLRVKMEWTVLLLFVSLVHHIGVSKLKRIQVRAIL